MRVAGCERRDDGILADSRSCTANARAKQAANENVNQKEAVAGGQTECIKDLSKTETLQQSKICVLAVRGAPASVLASV